MFQVLASENYDCVKRLKIAFFEFTIQVSTLSSQSFASEILISEKRTFIRYLSLLKQNDG